MLIVQLVCGLLISIKPVSAAGIVLRHPTEGLTVFEDVIGKTAATLFVLVAPWDGRAEEAIEEWRTLSSKSFRSLRSILIIHTEDIAAARVALNEKKDRGTWLTDDSGEIFDTLNASYLPWFALLDRDGSLLYSSTVLTPDVRRQLMRNPSRTLRALRTQRSAGAKSVDPLSPGPW